MPCAAAVGCFAFDVRASKAIRSTKHEMSTDMNTQWIRIVGIVLIAAVAIAAVVFGRMSSQREAEIRAVRDAYYAGHVDKQRARAMVGDVVENWQDPWGPQ
jgi:hypothetical protein